MNLYVALYYRTVADTTSRAVREAEQSARGVMLRTSEALGLV